MIDPSVQGELAWNTDALRLLVENVRDYAVFFIDSERRVRQWNAGAERLLGYTEAEILGEKADRFFTPEDIAAGQPEKEIEQALATGRGVDDRWHVRKDGSRFWSAGILTPLRDEAGTVHGFGKIMRDHTSLRLAEQARRDTEARLQTLADNLPRGAVYQAVRDSSGAPTRFTYMSAGIERMLGVSPAEAVADSSAVYGLIHPDDRDRVLAAEAESVRTNLPFDCRFRHYTRSGKVLWVHCRSAPYLSEGQLVWEGVVLDVTEQIEAEERLRREEARFRGLMEQAPFSIQIFASDGSTLQVNRAWSELCGVPAEFANGYNVLQDRQLEAKGILKYLRRAFEGEPVFTPAIEYHPNEMVPGQAQEAHAPRWVSAVAYPLKDGDSTVREVVLIHQDITARKRAEAALRGSEESLRLALESGNMGSWEWDIRSGRIHWSENLERIHGLPPGGFDGSFESFCKLVHPDDLPGLQDTLAKALETGTTYESEFRIVRPDGTTGWMLGRGRTYYDENGNPVRMVGIGADVTERRRSEEELRRQTALLKTITDNADSALCLIDFEGRFTFVNQSFMRITGYSESEVLGRLVHETLHYKYPDGRSYPVEECPLDNSYRKMPRPIRGHEDVFVRKDGSLFPIKASIAPLIEDGRPAGCVGEFRDVTREKVAEEALRRAERTSRFLADASRALAELTDRESTLQRVARLAVPDFADWCAVDMLVGESLHRVAVAHVDPEKVELAHEWNRRFPPDPAAPYGIWNVIRTAQPEIVSEITDQSLVETISDPELLEIMRMVGLRSYIGVPLKVRSRVLGVITFFAAESGRHYDERDLVVAEDLAHRAAVAIENVRLYDELREADRRKDDFLAMLAHELRNPLAPIQSGIDLIRLSANETEVVDLMSAQVQHLVRLVDDLLDVGRILRGRIQLKRAQVEFAEIARRAVEIVRPLFEAQKQHFLLGLPAETVWLEADPVRLTQVFSNLLHNSSKYTEQGGEIRLAAELEGNELVARVSDTGIGIDPELLPHVFELFRQATRAIDRAQGGLGIGLTIVKNLVEMHGGNVSAHSEGSGKGTTFTIRLPVLERSQMAADAAPGFEPAAEPRRVLVVDDNVPAAKLLVRLLEKLGHEVVAAHDGQAALTAAKASRPDLILLDIGLPVMDGYEVARRLCAMPEFQNTRIVALTGYGTDEDRRRSAEAGFDDHVTKPPSLEILKRILGDRRPPNRKCQ